MFQRQLKMNQTQNSYTQIFLDTNGQKLGSELTNITRIWIQTNIITIIIIKLWLGLLSMEESFKDTIFTKNPAEAFLNEISKF